MSIQTMINVLRMRLDIEVNNPTLYHLYSEIIIALEELKQRRENDPGNPYRKNCNY